MRKLQIFLLAVTVVAAFSRSGAQKGKAPASAAGKATHSMTMTRPADLKWSPMMLPGAEMAVVYGNPDQIGGLFAIRIRTADGIKVPPHWHPTDEHITVIQGTLLLGMGEKYDAAKLKAINPGDYGFVPKEMRHFANSRGKCIVQVHGIGPFAINWVNPADVPAAPAATPK